MIPDGEDDAADFNEKDITEKDTAYSASVVSVLHQSFVQPAFLRRGTSQPIGLCAGKSASTKCVVPRENRRYTGPGNNPPTAGKLGECMGESLFELTPERNKSSFRQFAELTDKDSTKESAQPQETPVQEEDNDLYDIFITAMCEQDGLTEKHRGSIKQEKQENPHVSWEARKAAQSTTALKTFFHQDGV